MQALINLITGFIALLAAAALAQFGVDLRGPHGAERGAEREVHRTADCRTAPAPRSLAASTFAATRGPRC